MSAVSNRCETTAHLGRACRGCPDCMGIHAPVSDIVRLARRQRGQFNIAAIETRLIERGAYSPKELGSKGRSVIRWMNDGYRTQALMCDLAKCRPEDIEDFNNHELCKRISALTHYRRQRVNYAGRVLP